jgi:hypothetical protein
LIGNSVNNCIVCKKFKTAKCKRKGEFMPLGIPARPFKLFGIDLVGRTPSKNVPYLTVVVYHFSKWVKIFKHKKKSEARELLNQINEYPENLGRVKAVVLDYCTQISLPTWKDVILSSCIEPNIVLSLNPETHGNLNVPFSL